MYINRTLTSMDSSFDSISADISRTTKKLTLVLNTPQGRRMMYIIGGIVVFFCFATIINKK
jgi:hypothetical protein